MGIALALLLVVSLAAFYIWRGSPMKSATSFKDLMRQAATLLCIGVGFFALMRGFYLTALFFGALGYFFGRGQFGIAGKPKQGEDPGAQRDASRVTTKWLDLTLNRSNGEISGRVLRGRFADRAFATLTFDELLSLREEIQDRDQQSLSILSAYIDRLQSETQTGSDNGRQRAQATLDMTRDEALDVLGLDVGASETDVAEAHRRLMMLVHPDRGGSDYLAAKINAAKAVLMSQKA
jgi:hypothetical protein